MTSSAISPPTSRGLLDELFLGRLDWDRLRSFPDQGSEEERVGDAAVAALRELLGQHIDPAELDRTGTMPPGLVELLRDQGWFSMLVDSDARRALSPLNAVRALEAAAAISPAVALMLGSSNGFGPAHYLPMLPDGPLHDLLARHVRTGSAHGTADTEAAGAASRGRGTVAVPVDDGAAYLITGEKVHIGNGLTAGLIDVSATVEHAGTSQIRIFFVETDSPGVQVLPQEYMGLHGAPFGVIRLDRVRVPAWHLLPASVDAWRDDPALVRLAVLGRMLTITPSSLAIAKRCLEWSADFVGRRSSDERPLGDHDEIQRIVAQTAADVYAIESVARWSLLSDDLAEQAPELTAAKNLVSVACWEVVDRTLSLLAAEGYETDRSKARRGAAPLPLERFARDARGLRISGGVDFLLDYWTALGALQAIGDDERSAGGSAAQPPAEPALSARNQAHLADAWSQARALGDLLRREAGRHGTDVKPERQHNLVLAGRMGITLLGMAVVLARTTCPAEHDGDVAQDLADLWCAKARDQLAGWWAQVHDDPLPDHAATSRRVLDTRTLRVLLRDAVADQVDD